MYYVYLLESEKDRKFYIGQTQNLEERLKYHNTGRSKYTKPFQPWKIAAFKTFSTRSQAMVVEKRFKIIKNREMILEQFK